MGITVLSSGKGGVGRTSLAVNAALCLAKSGKKVLLVDGDLGLSNIDVFLGLQPVTTLQHVLLQGKPLESAFVEAAPGLSVVTGGSGILELAQLGADEAKAFATTVAGAQGFDHVLVDAGAGVGAHVQAWMSVADSCLFITTPDPASLMSGYSSAKALFAIKPECRACIAVNLADGEAQGRAIGLKMQEIMGRFLNRPAEFLGVVPRDKAVARAARMRIPFVVANPVSPASRSVGLLALKIAAEPMEQGFLPAVMRLVRYGKAA